MKHGIEIVKDVHFCQDKETARLYGMEHSDLYSHMQVLIDWDKREIRTFLKSKWNSNHDVNQTVKF